VQSGFVLSFAAVAALLFAFRSKREVENKKRGTAIKVFFQAQWVVFIGLFPVMALLNLPSPLISPFANMVAIPALSFVILPSAFLALLVSFFSESLSLSLFQFSGTTLAYLLEYLEHAEHLAPRFRVHSLLDTADSVVLIIAAVLVLSPQITPQMRWCKAAGGLFASAVLIMALAFPKPPQNRIQILDVGQGLSAVVEGEKGTLIFDLGAKFSDSFSIANQVLMPYLENAVRRPVTHLILSHSDNDHAGDAPAFAEKLATHQTSEFEITSGEAESIDIANVQSCHSAYSFPDGMLGDAYTLEFLWPLNPNYQSENANNRSCVLLLTLHGKQILFTGDIEKDVEKILLEQNLLPSNVDVLIAPHHGSSTSSSFWFVNRVKPKHVIFSAGYKNRYKHPAANVVARYEAFGTRLWNTAEAGAISISVIEDEITMESERFRNRRRWYIDE
jgi:competence protein ComEC